MNNPSLRQQLGGHAQTWGMTQWNNRNILTKTIDIYHRALEQIQTIQPTTDTIPEGEYGLIRQPGIHRDDVESIFRFEVDILFYTRIWKELLLYLPRDYSIPDTAVMKTLANTGLPE
ncbi:hypothetical protein EXW96_03350 [Paenibacillus sp. JMULE4]|nr:hypothetical protein [Paenibacillus sp. JMULE4]